MCKLILECKHHDLLRIISYSRNYGYFFNNSNETYLFVVNYVKNSQNISDLKSSFLKSLLHLNLFVDFNSPIVKSHFLDYEKLNWYSYCSLLISIIHYCNYFFENFSDFFSNCNLILNLYHNDDDKILPIPSIKNNSDSDQINIIPYEIKIPDSVLKLETTKFIIKLNSVENLESDRFLFRRDITKFDYFVDYKDYNFSSPILLVNIGLTLREDIFFQETCAKLIYLDNRATIGGGLPDSWQVNISKIMKYVCYNPNIRTIIFIGNVTQIPKTWNFCDRILNPEENFIEIKNLLNLSHFGIFQKQIKKIWKFDDEKDVKQRILEILSPEMKSEYVEYHKASDLKINPGEYYSNQERILERKLEYRNLSYKDGIICKNLQYAYPTVVELMRSLSDDLIVEDQNNQSMKELISFKIILETVANPEIPLYFLKTNEQENFREYYNKNFKEKHLFGKRIFDYNDGFNQYKIQLEYIKKSIENKTATRRSNIIISSPEIDWGDSTDYILGLLSISILPRLFDDEWKINFVFNWRTVEVLVGFPYSLYGSCRFAEDFVDELKKLLRNEKISIGSLTYNAISLHFFVEEFNKEIAKNIIDQVSI